MSSTVFDPTHDPASHGPYTTMIAGAVETRLFTDGTAGLTFNGKASRKDDAPVSVTAWFTEDTALAALDAIELACAELREAIARKAPTR